MTNKEMIKNKLQRGFALTAEESRYLFYKYIEELEQQTCEDVTCEDAISRAEAIENFASWYGYDYDNQGYYRLLKQMPSVVPKQKTGKWKLLSYKYGHGGVYTCSKCGETEFYVSNYCPNCGAKMEVDG